MDLPLSLQILPFDEDRFHAILKCIDEKLLEFIVNQNFYALVSASNDIKMIIDEFSFIIDKNKGMEWFTLAKLYEYSAYIIKPSSLRFDDKNEYYNQKRSEIFHVGLLELAVTEISNVKEAINCIHLIPGYSIGERSICPKLKTLVSFMNDRLLLRRICMNLADLFLIDNRKLEYIDRNMFNKTIDVTFVHQRIHFMVCLTQLFEGIRQLSSFAQQFFPKEFLIRGLKLRNIMCHLERHFDAVNEFISTKNLNVFETVDERKAMTLEYYKDNVYLLAMCINYYCHYYTSFDDKCCVSNTYYDDQQLVSILKHYTSVPWCLDQHDDDCFSFYQKLPNEASDFHDLNEIWNFISKSCLEVSQLPKVKISNDIINDFIKDYREAEKLTLYEMYQIKKLHKYLGKEDIQNSQKYDMWMKKLSMIFDRDSYYKLLNSTEHTMNDVGNLVELYIKFSSEKEYGDLKTITGRRRYERRAIISQFINAKKIDSSKLKVLEDNEDAYEAAIYSKEYRYISKDDKLIEDYINLEFRHHESMEKARRELQLVIDERQQFANMKKDNSLLRILDSRENRYEATKYLKDYWYINEEQDRLERYAYDECAYHDILNMERKIMRHPTPRSFYELYGRIIEINNGQKKEQDIIEKKQFIQTLQKLIHSLELISTVQPILHESIEHETMREFYCLQAGSLVRLLLDKKISSSSNTTFISNVKTIKVDKDYTLFDVLKLIQKNRGSIAHMNTPSETSKNGDSFLTNLKLTFILYSNTMNRIIDELSNMLSPYNTSFDISGLFQ